MSTNPPKPRLPDELHPLVLDNLRLAYEFANRSWRAGGRRLDLEDLIQVAIEGLVYGVIRYDPGRNNEMSTYVCYWIRQRLQAHVWKESSGGVNVPRPTVKYRHTPARVVGMSEDGFLPDTRPRGEDCDPGPDPGPFWDNVRRSTTPRGYALLTMLYRDGLTYQEAGERLGVTGERARQLKVKAIRELRDRAGCPNRLWPGN